MCRDIVHWTLRNKRQWNLIRYLYIFIQENNIYAFEDFVWKVTAMLSRLKRVKKRWHKQAQTLFKQQQQTPFGPCMSSNHYYRNHRNVTENICVGNGSKNPNIMTYTEPVIHSITWKLCSSVHLSVIFWSSQAVIWYYKPCQANSWVDYSIITFSASTISEHNLVGMTCPNEKTKSLGPTNSHLRYSCLQRTCNFRLTSWCVLSKYSFDS